MAFWIVLAVLLALLLCPVTLTFTLFGGQPSLTVRYLFLNLRIPRGEKAARKKEKRAARAQAKKAERAARKAKRRKKVPEAPAQAAPPKDKPSVDGETIRIWIEAARRALGSLGRAGRVLARGVRLRAVQLQVAVRRGDACETARAAGQLNATAWAAASLLQNVVRADTLYINIFPAFWQTRETVAVLVECAAIPLFWLAAALIALFGGLRAALFALKAVKNKEESCAADDPDTRKEQDAHKEQPVHPAV